MIDWILRKRNGSELSTEEINALIQAYTAGEIPDYQMSAFLMAVYFQGLSEREILDLTMAMVKSGDRVDLSDLPGIKVDKHSTGGVGDTTSLVLIPLVAACGVTVAKMTGRGLGHTGGTVDKLESIPGFRTTLNRQEFVEAIAETGVGITGQSANLTPADKKLYALRDVTGTVDQVGLIASSIMSKKIAAGADAIVLDVKVGSGAFLTTYEESLRLAKEMVKIGQGARRETVAVISDMSQPLGQAVGNALEVQEAIDVLKGRKRGRLLELCLAVGSQMLVLARRADSLVDARRQLENAIAQSTALEKFRQIIASQGGNPSVLDDASQLPQSSHHIDFIAPRSGWIGTVHCREVGEVAITLGAGRQRIEDPIDLAVGLVMHKELGDPVIAGEPLATLYVNDLSRVDDALQGLQRAIAITDQPVPVPPLLKAIVTSTGVTTL